MRKHGLCPVFNSRSVYTANVAKQWPTRSQTVSLTAGQSIATVIKSENSPSPQPNAHYLISHAANRV